METFLPEVTNIRSPTIFAPVVSPMSCLIEPRYSTFGDITASGGVWAAAGAAATRRNRVVRRAARIFILVPRNAGEPPNLRHDVRPRRTRRRRRGGRRAARGGRDRAGRGREPPLERRADRRRGRRARVRAAGRRARPGRARLRAARHTAAG